MHPFLVSIFSVFSSNRPGRRSIEKRARGMLEAARQEKANAQIKKRDRHAGDDEYDPNEGKTKRRRGKSPGLNDYGLE
jgi:hypothetical protein